MKMLWAFILAVTSTFVWADNNAASSPSYITVKGEVLEVLNVPNFTYFRLKTENGETWAATVQSQVQQGATITIEHAMLMSNFESKALKRKFPSILFGTLAGAGAATSTAPSASPSMGAETSGSHVLGMSSSLVPKKIEATGEIHVKKASGKNAQTVAEIMTMGNELKDKTVLVRGKVVKYNEGIMGKNWIHLRDGSGTVEKETNDLLVTSTKPAKVGDVVTAKGVVHINKDFGAGYSYKVLVEDATLQ